MADQTLTPRAPAITLGGVLIGLGVLALLAILAFVVVSARSDKALRTDAVTSAASSLAATTPPPPPK